MIQFLVSGGENVIVEWAQEILAKYKITIKKMWDFKDGVAFVYLTHALSGEAFSISDQVPTIDLDSLKSRDPKNTLKTAFRLANTHLGVPITLFPNPDSFDFLSVLFYVSQFMKFDLRNRPDRGSFPQLLLLDPHTLKFANPNLGLGYFPQQKKKFRIQVPLLNLKKKHLRNLQRRKKIREIRKVGLVLLQQDLVKNRNLQI